MQCSKSPFTPTFRSVPPFLAGREHILRDINRGFINGPGDPNLSNIFTGARGTGKTALLSLLSKTALEHGWIAANVSAMPGMLEDIIEHTKEAAGRYLSQPHTRVSGVQVGQRGGLARQYNQIVHFHSLSSTWCTVVSPFIRVGRFSGTRAELKLNSTMPYRSRAS